MSKCDICGREIYDYNIRYAGGHKVCYKHETQYRKYGKFLDTNPRTRYDPNDFTILGGIAAMHLYDINGDFVASTLIDTEDINRITFAKWNVNNSGYVMGKDSSTNIQYALARVIMNADDPNLPVDHINHDTLDNRKCNLRVVTDSNNNMNKDELGYHYAKDRNKWRAIIYIDKLKLNLGDFEYEYQAAFVRWYAEQILFGCFAFPKPMPFVLREEIVPLMQQALNKLNTRLVPLGYKEFHHIDIGGTFDA